MREIDIDIRQSSLNQFANQEFLEYFVESATDIAQVNFHLTSRADGEDPATYAESREITSTSIFSECPLINTERIILQTHDEWLAYDSFSNLRKNWDQMYASVIAWLKTRASFIDRNQIMLSPTLRP